MSLQKKKKMYCGVWKLNNYRKTKLWISKMVWKLTPPVFPQINMSSMTKFRDNRTHPSVYSPLMGLYLDRIRRVERW